MIQKDVSNLPFNSGHEQVSHRHCDRLRRWCHPCDTSCWVDHSAGERPVRDLNWMANLKRLFESLVLFFMCMWMWWYMGGAHARGEDEDEYEDQCSHIHNNVSNSFLIILLPCNPPRNLAEWVTGNNNNTDQLDWPDWMSMKQPELELPGQQYTVLER